jgi:MIP family channel proteins
LAEFLGTLVLVSLGDGTVAQTVLSQRIPLPRGSIVTVNLGWGIAVMMGVYACGGASGGHINPAFTVALALYRKLPWKRVPFYLLGQYLGAFMGSVGVYICYLDALQAYDGGVRSVTGPNATAGIWATYPQEHVSTMQGLVDQIFATGLLVLLALAITDPRNMSVPKGLAPIAVGSIVIALTTAFEFNCGAALNPARDLGPRLFTLVGGWGGAVFSFREYNWFWVPVVGPHLGAILGAGLYIVCVEMHWPDLAQPLSLSKSETEMIPVSRTKEVILLDDDQEMVVVSRKQLQQTTQQENTLIKKL